MVTDMTWNDFASLYYEQLKDIARKYLYNMKNKSACWNERINEEDICENATVDALEAAYINFDDKRGKSPIVYMSSIVHNSIVNELKNEQKSHGESVDVLGDKEENYSFGVYIANLKQCVRESISELSAIDQIVLKYYINNPKTYIADVKEDLGISENAISIRKNRAVKQLASIMKRKAYYDYINAHYQGVGTSFGFLQAVPEVGLTDTYVNRIDPQFDLEDVASKFCRFLEQYFHSNR